MPPSTGAMPKSAFAANAQAKVCAVAIAALLRGEKPAEPRLINTCYSLVAPDYGISVAEVFKPANGMLVDVEGAGGSARSTRRVDTRAPKRSIAEGWFKTITERGVRLSRCAALIAVDAASAHRSRPAQEAPAALSRSSATRSRHR